MRLSTNVIVIGAGPAGATAAKVLSKSGIDVILLERNLAFVKPCGGGLSINAFDEFGIPGNIIQTEGEKRVYRIPVWNKSKILFAGDSAGQVLPLTYEGIYYAMKAGEFAARAIIENKVDNYNKDVEVEVSEKIHANECAERLFPER